MKNDIPADFTRKQLLEFCQNNHLIGVGWPDIKTRQDSEDAIRADAKQQYSNATPGFKAVNSMRSMRPDDLIWTRFEGIYYLCKVTGLWKDSRPTELHDHLDMANYVDAHWLCVGTEDAVPGKIISSFRPAATVQRVNGVTEISQQLWNHYSQTQDYPVQTQKLDIWSALPSESIEELVLLYLQAEKGFYLYSSTLKLSTQTFECVMTDKEGIPILPQVKSGKVSLNANDYLDCLSKTPAAHIYLFAASESYIKNNCPQIHYISRAELEQFLRKNRKILPALIGNWLDLCRFYDS